MYIYIYIYIYILKFSWDTSVEKAVEMSEDPRLPGGQTDTQYVIEESGLEAKPRKTKSRLEVLMEMIAEDPETTLAKKHDEDRKLPSWLQDPPPPVSKFQPKMFRHFLK